MARLQLFCPFLEIPEFAPKRKRIVPRQNRPPPSSERLAGSGAVVHDPDAPPALPTQNAVPVVVPGFPIQVSSCGAPPPILLAVSNSASDTCWRIISHCVICPAPFVEKRRKLAWSNGPVVFRLVSVLRPSVKLNYVGVIVAFTKPGARGLETVNDPERSHWTGQAATPVKVVKAGPV